MRSKGFTLIELLVVIAIIAILSTLILGGLGKAREKGNDAKVKSQLNGLRTAAQNYYNSYDNYSTASDCSSGIFNDTEFSMADYTNEGNYPAGTRLKCNADGAGYAVSANLGSEEYWCVDSQVGSKLEPTDPGAVTSCP